MAVVGILGQTKLSGGLPPMDTLENTSWANIAKVAAAGKASEYWTVGATKTITLGTTVLGSTSITVEIIGFNHDDLTAGGKAPITFGIVDCFNTKRQMNTTDTNVGSWGDSAMRTFARADMWNALPADLRAVIKDVNKLTAQSGTSSIINTSVDNLFMLSEIELFGTTSYSYTGEGAQYSKFTSNATRIKKVGTIAEYWWTRSPRKNATLYFVCIATTGAVFTGTVYASGTSGVAVGFCV